jgi:predicted dinucleotide-binding enzyme
MTSMQISVIGAGAVGANLAQRFSDLGHQVRFGARDVASPKVAAALARIPGSTATLLSEALAGADLAVLAVPYAALDETLVALGDPGDTVLIDATNTVGLSLSEGAAHIVEEIHRRHPSATVVKAFNTIGAEAFLDPEIDGHRLFLPVAGPGAAAERVADLARSMGFDARVIGDIDTAHLLESFAALWIHLAFRTGLGRRFGFSLAVPS